MVALLPPDPDASQNPKNLLLNSVFGLG